MAGARDLPGMMQTRFGSPGSFQYGRRDAAISDENHYLGRSEMVVSVG